MSTIKTDTLSNVAGTASVPTDTIVNGSAKAWVNFNGTGTVAIRAAFNVSSITDNGTGLYTVNFIDAMPDENYLIVAAGNVTVNVASADDSAARTVGAVRIRSYDSNAAAVDSAHVQVAIFR